MKILVATRGHSPDDDRIFHKEIRSLLKHGHEVTLVTRIQQTVDSGLPRFRNLALGPIGVVQFSKELQTLAREWQPAALQIHEFDLLVAAGRIKRELGIPIIYDVQDAHKEMWATFSSKPPLIKHIINQGLLQFEKRHLKYVDRVSALSPHIQRQYQKWGLKVVLVPNYPHLISIDLNIPREPLVIYHGQLSVKRGIPLLVSAFAGVVAAVPEARLEIYGNEWVPGLVQRLHASINHIGMGKSIAIKPTIPYQNILMRLTGARVGVIPFTDAPLFRVAPPNKLYEYMLCGCAVAASDLPVLREQGKTAVYFVPPDDAEALTTALIRLLRDEDLRRSLTRQGRQLIESLYHWELVEPEYLTIYEELA
ncbi:MAG: glycosyltransferase family 4 protein [Candidatus Neomarinimicrobiota bacterium]